MKLNSDILLNRLKEVFFPDLHIFKERFARIDAYSKKLDLWIEVKVKDEYYPWIYVTKSKWDVMREKKRCLYINAMMKPDGSWYIYSFKIHRLEEPSFDEIYNPDASNELYTGWKKMPMGQLHISNSTEITNKLIN